MKEKDWNSVTIGDVLTSLNSAYPIDASLERMGKILGKSRSTCWRWMTRRRIPMDIPSEDHLTTEQLFNLLYNIEYTIRSDDIARGTLSRDSVKKNDPHHAKKSDLFFVTKFLLNLEKLGYNVDELRQIPVELDNRKDICCRIARAARNNATHMREEYMLRTSARNEGIVPPEPPPTGDQVVREGTMIKAPHPCFPHRKDHSSDLFVKFYHDIATPYGRYSVPYKELFGHAAHGMKEYIEGKNISFNYEDFTVDYASRVTTCDFQEEVEKKRDAAAKIGYKSHPPKLCLVDYLETRSEDINGGETKYDLSLTFGTSYYLENLVWRDELQRNKKEQEIFRAVLASSSKEHLRGFDHGPWAAAGGGCWVITSDNFLVMSYRSPTRVGEVAGRLSYSSSGSYGRYTVDSCGSRIDNTPGNAMVKELSEELGLPEVKPEELVQISLGLDLERGLAQWSYLLQSKYAADDIAYFRQDWATTADEQTVFFVPLATPDICYRLLSKCEFEPGSAFSLYRLLTKRFGPPKIKP